MLRIAVAASLLVAAVEIVAALPHARSAQAKSGDVALQIGLLLFICGVVLGTLQWVALRTTEAIAGRMADRAAGRVRRLGYAAWIWAAPGALYVALAAERWPALGVPARTALGAGLFAGLLAAYGAARALMAWRALARERPRAVCWAVFGLSLVLFAGCWLADRHVLPRLYPRLHDLLGLLTLFAAEVVALAARDLLPLALYPYRRLLWAAVLVPLVLLGARRVRGFGSDPALAFVVTEHTSLAGRTLLFARRTLDRDGDGYAGVLGGGDCADDDPRVHPGALDLPENGRDEDCSGADLRLEELRVQETAAKAPVTGRFNVLLVTVDALRADHVGAYGYARKTTPHLDRLAARSLVFLRAYAQSNNTAVSIPALHTGRYASTSPWSFDHPKQYSPGWAYLTDEANLTLAEMLGDAGYATALFANRGPLCEIGLAQGFQVVKTRVVEQGAALSSHLESLKDRPWFAWLHHDEPHASYETQPGFDFGSSNIDRYDSEIAFADDRIGRVLGWLERTGRANDTVVVVTADHGEEFGEHGGSQHASTLYEEQIRVPLIVSIPGVVARRISEPVEVIGVVPTLLQVLGIEAPAFVDGRSLFAEVVGGGPAHAYTEHYNGTILRRALVTRRWKLISNTFANTLELYDLERDPAERVNRIVEERAILQRMQRELDTLTERRALFSVASARRGDRRALDGLSRMVSVLQRPELLRECASLLAAAAKRGSHAEAWMRELSGAVARRELAADVRVDLGTALERMGGVWALRGLVGMAGDPDAEVASYGSAAVRRALPNAPHPYKWPERAETAPELGHLAFGTHHGGWQVIGPIGRGELLGVRQTAWSSGPSTRVAFWLPLEPRSGDWVLEAGGWAHPDAPDGRLGVAVHVNGKRLGTLQLGSQLSQASALLPSSLLKRGPNFVDFVYPATYGPRAQAVRWSFAMLFPALPSGWDVLLGSSTERIEWLAGWDRFELWKGVLQRTSKGKRVELALPLDPSSVAYQLRFQVAAHAGTATIGASLNGHALGPAEVGTDWKLIELDVPAGALVKGANRVSFQIETAEQQEPLLRWHAINLTPHAGA